jgi:hypothetical protein
MSGLANELARQPLDHIAEPGQRGSLPPGRDDIEPRYLEPSVVIKPVPVRIHTGRRAKSHLPIAMNFLAKRAAAMIALDHDLTVHEFTGTTRLFIVTVGIAAACS